MEAGFKVIGLRMRIIYVIRTCIYAEGFALVFCFLARVLYTCFSMYTHACIQMYIKYMCIHVHVLAFIC